MESSPRAEVTDDTRRSLVEEMCVALRRRSDESDEQKVWQAASRFELLMWNSRVDADSYLTKMRRKIESLKREPSASERPRVGFLDFQEVAATATGAGSGTAEDPVYVARVEALKASNMEILTRLCEALKRAAAKLSSPHEVRTPSSRLAITVTHVITLLKPDPRRATARVKVDRVEHYIQTFLLPIHQRLEEDDAVARRHQQELEDLQVAFDTKQEQLLEMYEQETWQLTDQLQTELELLLKVMEQHSVPQGERDARCQQLQQQHQAERRRRRQTQVLKQRQLQQTQQQEMEQRQRQQQQLASAKSFSLLTELLNAALAAAGWQIGQQLQTSAVQPSVPPMAAAHATQP